jgi:hypothetical protein
MTKEMADDVEYHEEFVTNPRGLRLFTCGWLPASSSPKALIFLCHGRYTHIYNIPLEL